MTAVYIYQNLKQGYPLFSPKYSQKPIEIRWVKFRFLKKLNQNSKILIFKNQSINIFEELIM
jgi:hypothetical protein